MEERERERARKRTGSLELLGWLFGLLLLADGSQNPWLLDSEPIRALRVQRDGRVVGGHFGDFLHKFFLDELLCLAFPRNILEVFLEHRAVLPIKARNLVELL